MVKQNINTSKIQSTFFKPGIDVAFLAAGLAARELRQASAGEAREDLLSAKTIAAAAVKIKASTSQHCRSGWGDWARCNAPDGVGGAPHSFVQLGIGAHALD